VTAAAQREITLCLYNFAFCIYEINFTSYSDRAIGFDAHRYFVAHFDLPLIRLV
jgi:hypothetical protein